MDIPRPSDRRAKKIRRIAYGSCCVLVARRRHARSLPLASCSADSRSSNDLTDTVKRGEMIREVRGIGTLVPVDIRWIAAQSSARVDKIILQSGASVKPDSVILELSDPQLQRDVLDAEYAYKAAEADLANLKAQLANNLMTQKSAAAVIESDYQQAKLQAEADQQLASQGLRAKSLPRNPPSPPSSWASERN